jgi:hypothetical protein
VRIFEQFVKTGLIDRSNTFIYSFYCCPVYIDTDDFAASAGIIGCQWQPQFAYANN